MAESTEVTVDRKLEDIFKEGYDIYNGFETIAKPFNSPEFQGLVKKSVGLFEDATRLVSLLGLFSSNEAIEEIPTEHLKFLLLPFFLGQLTSKSSTSNRENVLKISQIYYKDFIKRCEEYDLCKPEEEHAPINTKDEMRELVQAAGLRNAKLEQYRIKKSLDDELKMMKIAIEKEHVDEEIRRDFFLKLIKSSIFETKDELKSIEQELEILAFKKTEELSESDSTKHVHRRQQPQQSVAPLKPIIITRDVAQKAIFGMGYPSLPIMTVKEFYDQRVSEGIFPDQKQVEEMNKKGKPDQSDMDAQEELEKEENELLAERDDDEYLNRQRAMDEYKDEVRRGDGNRHNRS